MPRVFKLFTFFASIAFILAATGYLAFHAITPKGYVFGGLYRMPLYHESHPFQYIAIVAFIYGIIAAACAHRWNSLIGLKRFSVIIGIIISTILIASIPGGVLWKLHDMQAGYFTTGARFWSDLLWGASVGLKTGWLVIALSMPYNVIGLILGYFVTHFGFRISTPVA